MAEDESAVPSGRADRTRRERPRPGPRPALSVEAIARAGVGIADAEGLGAVSMARVAGQLGVTPMALYRYVSSKDELLLHMADTALQPPAGKDDPSLPWRERLERWCRASLAILVEHSWTAELLSRPVMGPNRVAWLERGLQALRGLDLPEHVKAAIIGMLSLHLLTEGQAAVAFQNPQAAGVPDPQTVPQHPALLDFGAMLTAATNPVEHPAITAALAAGAFGEAEEDVDPIELGLTILLDGVESLVHRLTEPR